MGVLVAAVALMAVLVGGVPAAAGASSNQGGAPTGTPEQQLAERYAPTVVMRRQDKECDRRGEGLRPVPVDVVLGRDDVVLRDRAGREVQRAPTAADLADKGPDYWLDLPGYALNPRCDYDRWFRRIGRDVPTTVYAHVSTEAGKPGQLALQYWFYWVFNDWNDEHESDWEMIQLLFEADSAAEALGTEPVEVGFAQHEGGQRASWDGGHLLIEDGTHPVAHAGAGSHSSHYRSALYLGHSADEGFGCDNTTTPTVSERARVILLPTWPGPDQADLAWLTYQGHWGERQGGPNNGPTGPNMKTQWLEPISWSEGWRDGAVTVPAWGTLGSSTTEFACKSMEAVSILYVTYLRTPWLVLGGTAALAALLLVLARRTGWSPAPVEPVDCRRRSGEILRSALRLYRRHPGVFLGIGAVAVPIGAVFSALQFVLFEVTGLGIVIDVASGDVLVGLLGALLAGAVGTTTASSLVYAGCAWTVARLGEGRRPAVGEVYRRLWARRRPVVLLVLRLTVVTALLAITVVGIPFAVVYVVRRLPAFAACMVEELDASSALRRSRELVAGRTGRVLLFTLVLNLLTAAVGPVVGLVALLTWSPSLTVVNLLGGLLYTAAVPFAGIGLTMLFYDLRRRRADTPAEPADGDDLAGPPPEAPVPAEV